MFDQSVMLIGFFLVVFVFLAIDLGIFHKKTHEVSIKEALVWCGIWFSLAMLFNIFVWKNLGTEAGLQFFTGYLIELSLSVDNLFVILVIFTAFNVPGKYQHRVLYWGILGAIVLRGVFILLGSALVKAYDWIFIFFGLVLLYAAYRMQFKKESFNPRTSVAFRIIRKIIPFSADLHNEWFFINKRGRKEVTLLFITLLVVEFTDIIFAFDSIPAIFAITTDPLVIFTSNIFAVLGLRSLYFVLANMQSIFTYLKTGLAVILLFIAVKLLIIPWYHVPILASLLFILAVLAGSIGVSLLPQTRKAT